jgi:hypothetical protein
MQVAVITPYFKTSLEWLHQCHSSVKEQTHPCTHFIIADGIPYDEVDSWEAQHIKLPVNTGDYGDTPRGVGSVVAIGQGFDAIAYLDADNWYSPEHISTLVQLHKQSGAAVVTSARNLHRLDGTLLGKCFEVDGKKFVDTSCLMLTRRAFDIIQAWWLMPPKYHAIDDRVVWSQIRKSNLRTIHSGNPTLAYRTAFSNHYRKFGEEPPAGTKTGQEIYELLHEIRKKQMQQNQITIHLKK